MAKELRWVGRSGDDIRDFPAEARREAGHQLHLVQLGLEPDDWRPMPSVGAGVVEIPDRGRERLKELQAWRREEGL